MAAEMYGHKWYWVLARERMEDAFELNLCHISPTNYSINYLIRCCRWKFIKILALFSPVWTKKLPYVTNWFSTLFQFEKFHLDLVQTKAIPFPLQKCFQSNMCIFLLFSCSLGMCLDLSEYLNTAFLYRSLILNFQSIYNINMFIHMFNSVCTQA